MYKKIEESQTLLINTQSRVLQKQDKKVIKFGFGQSPFLPPQNVLAALEKAVHHKEYSSVQGDFELRELMSKFHKEHNGLEVHPNNILVAPGSKILIYTILLAFEQADVFIPSPAWVSYAPQAKLAGHHIIRLNTTFKDRWRITPNDIIQAVNLKKTEVSILILNYPGNPDGLTYTEDELIELAKVAKSQNILVISDEIYGLLNHSYSHYSFANYYPEKTITTTGLSKWCGAGGWRFGAAFLYENIEPAFKQALIGIASETYSCAPTPIQVAAKTAYQNFSEINDYLVYQITMLKEIGNFCTDRLNFSNISVHKPSGGFYVFPDFTWHKKKLNNHGITTSSQLCEQLLAETGVAILPASAFGFDEDYLAARLAYVDFKEPKERSNFDLKTDCPNIVEGIELICSWIENM